MGKRYIAIGVDVDGDVVATEMSHESASVASETLQDVFDNVTVHHILEIDVPDKPVVKPTVTKLKIN